jgi:hypothetical protein
MQVAPGGRIYTWIPALRGVSLHQLHQLILIIKHNYIEKFVVINTIKYYFLKENLKLRVKI